METKNLYWLAGILEGEGSFCMGPPSNPNCPRISIQMTDEDVIAKVAKLFRRTYHRYVPKNENHKPWYTTQLTGTRAVALMTELQPLMSARRQAQIDVAIQSHDPDARKKLWKSRRKLDDSKLKLAKERLVSESLRAIARDFGVHHETLRRLLG